MELACNFNNANPLNLNLIFHIACVRVCVCVRVSIEDIRIRSSALITIEMIFAMERTCSADSAALKFGVEWKIKKLKTHLQPKWINFENRTGTGNGSGNLSGQFYLFKYLNVYEIVIDWNYVHRTVHVSGWKIHSRALILNHLEWNSNGTNENALQYNRLLCHTLMLPY